MVKNIRVAVFGAQGFIGKEFVIDTPPGYEVSLFNLPDVDIRKPESFTENLKKIRPDVVVNLAAKIGTLLSTVSVREMFETNTMGCLNIAYASREAGAQSYIFISSTVVHGENTKSQHHGRFSGFFPKHSYSASKTAAEYSLQQFAKQNTDMSIVVLRPPMVIGEGIKISLPPTEFVRDILSGKEIQILGDGLHEREYVSLTDVATGIWKAVEWSITSKGGYHPFFLTGNRISMRDLAEKIVKKLGGNIVYKPGTKQVFSLTTDPTDTEKILGWNVKDSIDDILEDVVDFVRKEK